ncbi:membrane protein [Cytophagales bacterium WSM2-2]|nr:membrane protein [Cytophagales bacterium WSM2-2]
MNNKFSLTFLISVFFFSFSHAQQTVTLEDVVQMALQKNYDIQVARTTAATQLTDKQFLYGAFIPTINASGTYSRNNNYIINQQFPFKYGTSPQEAQDGTEHNFNGLSYTTNASIQAAWTVFDGTRMFATRRRLIQLAEWGETNIRNQMMNTVAITMTNFYNIVRQQEQLKAIQEVMAVNLERVKLAERKLEVGTGAKPELLQAKVDLNAQRTLVVQQEILIQQLKDQLNGQVAFGLPATFIIADTIPINLDLNRDEITSAIENSNQTVLAARKNLDVATTAVTEARAGRSPIIQVLSSYGLNRTENKVQFNGAVQKLSHTQPFSLGFGVSVPILNNLSATRLIAQAKVTQSRMQAIYDQQKTLATVGVLNAFTNYENSKRILQIQEENILVAKENVVIALEGFRRGITTYIELRTANQSLSDAYNQLIAARFSTKASEIELMRLQGSLLK